MNWRIPVHGVPEAQDGSPQLGALGGGGKEGVGGKVDSISGSEELGEHAECAQRRRRLPHQRHAPAQLHKCSLGLAIDEGVDKAEWSLLVMFHLILPYYD